MVTFQVLCKNEQNYAEVVDLMNSYGNHIVDIYRKANLNLDGLSVHIGGDQLTRNDFSVSNEFLNQQQLKERICLLVINYFWFLIFSDPIAIWGILKRRKH